MAIEIHLEYLDLDEIRDKITIWMYMNKSSVIPITSSSNVVVIALFLVSLAFGWSVIMKIFFAQNIGVDMEEFRKVSSWVTQQVRKN